MESISFARETRPFSPPEKVKSFIDILPGKEKSSEDIADLRIVKIRVVIVDFIKNRFFLVQYIVLLVVIAKFHVRAKDGSTLIRRFQFTEHFEKGCFTGSVFPDQSNTFSAEQFKGNTLKKV